MEMTLFDDDDDHDTREAASVPVDDGGVHPSVQRLETPAECDRYIVNVARMGRQDLVVQARIRMVQLQALTGDCGTPLDREALEAVHAYEQVLQHQNGKKTRATHTRTQIRKHGTVAALEQVIRRAPEARGLDVLTRLGLDDYTFEAVVLRHPEAFAAETVGVAEAWAEQTTG